MHTVSIRFLTRAFGVWALAGLLLGSSAWLDAVLRPLGGSALWLQWVPGLCLIWLHHRRISRSLCQLIVGLTPRPRRNSQARWIRQPLAQVCGSSSSSRT